MPKRPQDHTKYGLKKKSSGLIDLALPSEGLVQVKRPGLQGLIKAGVVDNFDTLTAIVATETIPKAEGKPATKPKQMTGAQISEALDAMDKIVIHVVAQPLLQPTTVVDEETGKSRPIRDDERDDDLTYVDEMEMDDKSFIVQFVMGGTADLAAFRAQSARAMDSVSAG